MQTPWIPTASRSMHRLPAISEASRLSQCRLDAGATGTVNWTFSADERCIAGTSSRDVQTYTVNIVDSRGAIASATDQRCADRQNDPPVIAWLLRRLMFSDRCGRSSLPSPRSPMSIPSISRQDAHGEGDAWDPTKETLRSRTTAGAGPDWVNGASITYGGVEIGNVHVHQRCPLASRTPVPICC